MAPVRICELLAHLRNGISKYTAVRHWRTASGAWLVRATAGGKLGDATQGQTRAQTPRRESGTGERPRQIGDGGGGAAASPIPDKSGTGVGERPRPRQHFGQSSDKPPAGTGTVTGPGKRPRFRTNRGRGRGSLSVPVPGQIRDRPRDGPQL